MNLQQLEAVCHITRHRYNIPAAADAFDFVNLVNPGHFLLLRRAPVAANTM
ncbi:MAG: hypothetical protein HYY78_17605 [Betaproteobacteria bacterium]|nr:hypothetical protein [Betaproteobacteria bacterium]